jgi:transcriptional regulator with XRE-family HTH domain
MISTAKHASAIARLRAEIGVTQAAVAEKAGMDQSRVSRIEKGEIADDTDVNRVLDALTALGAKAAGEYKAYAAREWFHIQPPSFWNPERACLEISEDALGEIAAFLDDDERPWPLRRQIERHQESLLRAAAFLNRLNHTLAFIGDIGVGKSTAICFLFDLLVPPSMADRQINRPVLETGAGGTTICEVHIKAGPEFGISLVPMNDSELRDLVADFCAARWMLLKNEQREASEIGVGREVERAIRNMSGLGRRRETVGGKLVYHDPVNAVAQSCANEEEFRTRVLGLMALPDRTRRELWYDSATRKHPMEWVTETFTAINNGHVKEVSLPRSIDLLIPSFGRNFGELEISVVDTKGVDDVAVREDLDARLKDSRTAIIFCSRFNDAPGTTAQMLLQHMRQTFSERVDTGKVSLLPLPRAGEARAMKDDMGEQALTDAEGYEFKRMQVSTALANDDLAGVPTVFFNVESDDPASARAELFGQLTRIRKEAENRLFDLCAAAQEIITDHEASAFNAAIEEVAARLNTFLKGNRALGTRERLAHAEAINTVRGVRYAATLWASTRRSGEYSGLNIVHLIGVGAARDARRRSDGWFKSLDAFLKSLKADEGLTLGARAIDQIAKIANASKLAFLEGAQRGGVEVYREPLTQAPIWSACASEWGRGPGFKHRVADRLETWLDAQSELKETLENLLTSLWEQTVISPLLRLVEEGAPEAEVTASNVIPLPNRRTG